MTSDPLLASLRRAREGDPSGLRELWSGLRPMGLVVIRRMLWSHRMPREEAEDIYTAAFLKMIVKLSHFDERAKVSTWFHKIAVNTTLDFLRSMAPKRRREVPIDAEGAPVLQEPGENWVERQVAWEGRLQLVQAVGECMERLSPTLREAMELYYVEERGNQAECAEVTNLPTTENAFAARLSRARSALLECVQKRLRLLEG